MNIHYNTDIESVDQIDDLKEKDFEFMNKFRFIYLVKKFGINLQNDLRLMQEHSIFDQMVVRLDLFRKYNLHMIDDPFPEGI